jgi:hypothetical protein
MIDVDGPHQTKKRPYNFNKGLQMTKVLLLLLLAFNATADDKRNDGNEFKNPVTHERTRMQEEYEAMRLRIIADTPIIIPGVRSVPSCVAGKQMPQVKF